MLSPEYIAGLFDGEGCVSLCYSKIRPWKKNPSKMVLGFKFVIGLCNTFGPVLYRLQEQFGGDISTSFHGNKVRNLKPVYAWKITGTEAQRKFLLTIEPFSIIKLRQVELGLSYLETKVGSGKRLTPDAWNRRIELFKEFREANMRGTGRMPANDIPAVPADGWNPKKRSYSDIELAEMMTHVRACRLIRGSSSQS